MTTLKSVSVTRKTGKTYKILHLIAIFDTGMVQRKTFKHDDGREEIVINTMTDEQFQMVRATRVNGKYIDYDAPKFQKSYKKSEDDGEMEAVVAYSLLK